MIWFGHVNRMASEVFEYNRQGSRVRGGILYKQILINTKLQTGKIEKQS